MIHFMNNKLIFRKIVFPSSFNQSSLISIQQSMIKSVTNNNRATDVRDKIKANRYFTKTLASNTTIINEIIYCDQIHTNPIGSILH